MITSSTGFQASSRVISTSSDMLEQLLLIVR
ncbi:MAG: flagellar basal body rod C-terminal domain-containing protein [Phycisphaerae bacterium]